MSFLKSLLGKVTGESIIIPKVGNDTNSLVVVNDVTRKVIVEDCPILRIVDGICDRVCPIKNKKGTCGRMDSKLYENFRGKKYNKILEG